MFDELQHVYVNCVSCWLLGDSQPLEQRVYAMNTVKVANEA